MPLLADETKPSRRKMKSAVVKSILDEREGERASVSYTGPGPRKWKRVMVCNKEQIKGIIPTEKELLNSEFFEDMDDKSDKGVSCLPF